MDDFIASYGNNSQEEVEQKNRNDILEDYPVSKRNLDVPIPDAKSNQNNEDSGKQNIEVAIKDDSSMVDLQEELNELIGLENVKLEVQRLIQYARIQEMRKSRGLSASSVSYHSVFYGNPGTGKTTIARIYGKMLNSLGLLSKGHIVETDRSGLIGNYIGQTSNKTNEKIKEALGGVLFIDEAYSLYKGEHSERDYGREALEIIIKRMEDFRDDLVIIVAGYPKPMKKFLQANEGLKSRFSSFIEFDDYPPEQLIQIFDLFRGKENYKLTEDAEELVRASIENAYNMRDETFGNARYVRNLFEQIIRNHALRLGNTIEKPTDNQLQLIKADDVPFITKNDI